MPGPSLDSGIRAPVGLGTETAKSPGTCQGPGTTLTDMQGEQPGLYLRGRGPSLLLLLQVSKAPSSSPRDWGLSRTLAGDGGPTNKVWGQALRTIL